MFYEFACFGASDSPQSKNIGKLDKLNWLKYMSVCG